MLYVARHGQTTWNVAELISGLSDVPLTEMGQQQAKELAEEVSRLERPITKIIHSPLKRAKDTAQAVADKNHLPMIADERLVEMNYGDFDGMPQSTPAFQKARVQFAKRFPNGESVLDTYARVVPLLEEVLADEANTYLLVCHNGLIRAIRNYFEPLENAEFFKLRTPNATLVPLEKKR